MGALSLSDSPRVKYASTVPPGSRFFSRLGDRADGVRFSIFDNALRDFPRFPKCATADDAWIAAPFDDRHFAH